ncbi:MAG: PKD domain-containing protein [Bacteroidia bacterium]|nr:PKD domain-containing protein [Bacteroidia bacterium]
MRYPRILLFGLLISALGGAQAQAPMKSYLWPDPETVSSDLRFIRNAGQWDQRIEYRVQLNGGEILLEPAQLTYRLYHLPPVYGHRHEELAPHLHDESDSLIRWHVFRVEFAGAQQAALAPERKFREYHNYFLGNDPARWAGGVPLYGKITYQALYPGVDLRLYGSGDALKYDFLLQPGADAAQIRMVFRGAEQVRLDRGGNLQIRTSVREMTELAPVAWQYAGDARLPVACRFRLQGDTLSYEFPEGFDPALPLVIDPTLIFSTYTGSSANNWGFTATYDDAGNAYAGGIQFGSSIFGAYPVTAGAFQQSFQGGETDAAISKFSPDGSALIWSTYLGGSAGTNPFTTYNDQPHSMIVSATGELVVMGRTNSPNFPTTAGAFDQTPNGGFDIFVTRFNAAGTGLVASTLIGGADNDGVNGSTNLSTSTDTKYNYGDDARGEVILDDAGNVYVAGSTNSNNFPTTPGAFRSSRAGGQDAVVFKLSPSLGSLLFSTYLGGNEDDAAYSLKVDNAGRTYVTGGTASSNFPAIAGLHSSYRGGTTDGFVAKLNASGTAVLNSTFIGTNDYDQTFFVELDTSLNVYLVGQTEGNFQVFPPPGQNVYQNSGGKQFIIKLNNDLNAIVFSTVFGAVNALGPNISPTAFLVDRCENIYVSGWGGSTNFNSVTVSGMPVTPDAFDQVSEDGSDFYMIVLTRDAQSLLYASFFGGFNNGTTSAGDHVDGGTSRFDKNGVIYHAVCAGCWGNSSFPTTPGVWSPTNNATIAQGGENGCNLAIFKLSFNLAGVEADFIPRDQNNIPLVTTEGCAPLFVRFDNTSLGLVTPALTTYAWDFGDGATSTLQEPTHTFQNAGTYLVRLIITDPTSCNITDTTFETIIVYPPPAVDAGPDIEICLPDTVQLTSLTAAASYAWTPTNLIVGPSNVQNPLALAPASGIYVLTITDVQGCVARDTVRVTVGTGLEVIAREDTLICRGGSVRLNAAGQVAGGTYLWTSSPPVALSNPTALNPLASGVDTTTQFFLQVTDPDGCLGFDTVEVRVFEVFTFEDTSVCTGNSIQLTASGGVTYSWLPDNGTLSNRFIANPLATPSVSTTYTVTSTGPAGCISTKSFDVQVLPLPSAAIAPAAPICFGQSVRLFASGGASYRWSPGLSLSDPFVSDPVADPDVTTRYQVTVTDAAGCVDTASITVTVNPLPNIDAGEDQTICEGTTAQLQATGGTTYLWSPAGSLNNPGIANPVASPARETLYIVIAQDANECQNSDSVLVSLIARPITEVTGVNRSCDGGAVELTASGGDSYRWNTGETTAQISVLPLAPTWYVATAFIGNCAGIPDSIQVDQEFDFPEAGFTLDPATGYAPQRVTFTNTSFNAASYLWSFGFGSQTSRETDPDFIFPAAGEYTVTLIAWSAGGCPDTAVQTITLDNVTLHVPSGFTPNRDGTNDNFYVGYVGIRTLNVRIFSRWGLQVYSSDDPDFRWDGTYLGRAVPEGVYVYVINGIGENEVLYERSGTVTVIR